MNKYLDLIGTSLLFGQTIVLYHTFLIAYFNPSKSVTIYINQLGEANIEFILLPVILLIGLVLIISKIKEMKKDGE